MIDETAIGPKIKSLRLERGLNLQDVANTTGFTKGYLSKVENSKKAPPVSTLLMLAKALGVNISEIFSETENKAPITLVKKSEHITMARDGTAFGYSYEPLAHKFPLRHMDPYILTLPVKPRQRAVFQHKGEEILLVLEGTMRFVYGDKEFVVEEGDCVYFDSSTPHFGMAEGSKPVKCVMVIYSEE
ncbi:MAG: cupin domain-containing protein [Desulfomonile tiedjei]|uniref:Cupin domain-containing protein n=1 Tax=Desulfomonile tiedjei TaxID=2358 RepID=A0A9D6Z411_9BACT|nr:cupin domain-containing protein [Desulfomonile tiedjei]